MRGSRGERDNHLGQGSADALLCATDGRPSFVVPEAYHEVHPCPSDALVQTIDSRTADLALNIHVFVNALPYFSSTSGPLFVGDVVVHLLVVYLVDVFRILHSVLERCIIGASVVIGILPLRLRPDLIRHSRRIGRIGYYRSA